jgi:hypothetical protein
MPKRPSPLKQRFSVTLEGDVGDGVLNVHALKHLLKLLLRSSPADLPDFPRDELGKAFATVNRAAKGAGVTLDHVAVPLLGIASGLIGVARRVQASTSWLEPCTLWCAVVGYSGDGKTPGLDVTKRALAAVERENRNAIVELQRKHDSKVEAARAVRDAWKKTVQEAIANGCPAPEMPKGAQEPDKFIAPKLYVSDGTIERLGELLTARPQGIVRILDELAGMFTNMKRYSGGQDNEFWLEAWNGNSFAVERIGRQLYIDHLLVGVTGGFQPDKLIKAFAGDDDGMYARFNFAWPAEAPFKELADGISCVDLNLKGALSHLDALAKFDEKGKLAAERAIKLSAEARAEFEGLRQFVHAERRFLDGREREWLAKAPAHALRLVGTLCLLDWAWDERPAEEPTEIEACYMQRAHKLVREYFWPHARAVLRLAGLSDRHARTKRVLRWVRAKGLEEVSVQNVRLDALGRAVDEASAKIVIDTLVSAGWLRLKIPEAGHEAGRPALRWTVNPILLSEIPERPESYTNSCGEHDTQPEGNLSGVSGISGKQEGPNQDGLPPTPKNVNGNGQQHHTAPLNNPDSAPLCDHCGHPGTPTDPLHHGHWRRASPAGNWLHARCVSLFQAGWRRQ